MRVFKTFHPAELEAVVKKITLITDDNSSAEINSIPYFADGLPGIYFQQSCYDIFLNVEGRKLSNLFLYGQTVKPIEINTIGPFTVIVAHLYPTAIKSLFGINAHELTDTCMDFSLLPVKDVADLKNRLLEQNCAHTQINIITDSLRKMLHTIQPTINGELVYATDSIAMNGGAISLRSLQNELNVSERTFQRKFLEHVGVTPRLFKRICKFHTARSRLESNSFEKLTDIAYDQGFADQSHFNRIFKEFTGLTPRQYLINFTDAELKEDSNDIE